MNWIEKTFARAHRSLRDRNERKRAHMGARFSEHVETLSALAHAACAERRTILVRETDQRIAAAVGDSLLLPAWVDWFDDPALNLRALFHQAIVGGIWMRSPPPAILPPENEPMLRASRIADSRSLVLAELRRSFPSYDDWTRELHEAASRIDPDAHTVRWLEASRASGTGVSGFLRRPLTHFPEQAFLLWCEPWAPAAQASSPAQDLQADQEKRQRKQEPQPESSRAPSRVELVDLNQLKAEENPVMHSFEKLETAEEYRGGYRQVDEDGDVDAHRSALEEVEFRHLTRGGQASQSSYSADLTGVLEFSSPEPSKPESSGILMPEWNYKSRALMQEHCRLILHSPAAVAAGDSQSERVLSLMERHRPSVDQWRRRFSSLWNERDWKKGNLEGDEIDIDDYVRYAIDAKAGKSREARLYAKRYPSRRSLASAVLIDQSWSTDSWVLGRRVIDVEIESVLLMREVLSRLPDPIAVLGTWSHSRKKCFLSSYKDFEESWSRFVSLSGAIEPGGYTRLGPAIRHVTSRLANRPERRRLLILLTDGKPTDLDRYEGRHGIEDIRHAILEAKQCGVSVRALAVEKSARRYFPQLFGHSDYRILNDAAKLPETLFQLYYEAIRS